MALEAVLTCAKVSLHVYVSHVSIYLILLTEY